MATEIPLISVVLDDPPSTDDPANFDSRADAYLGVFPDLKTQQNAMAAAMNTVSGEIEQAAGDIEEDAAEVAAAALAATNAAGLVGRSNSALTVGAGTKNITLLAAKPSLVELNKRVAIVQLSDPSIKMFGTISSVTSSTVFVVTVVSSGSFGSGSYSAWQIIDAAFFGSAATKETIWGASDDTTAVTALALRGAREPVAVAYAASVALNMTAGINFVIGALTGNLTLANPTNLADAIGQTGSVTIAQDATGGRLISYGTYWKPRLAHEPLSTAASANDTLYYEVKSATRVEYSMGRGFLA